MQNDISKMILELYEIREDPLNNIDRLYSILRRAREIGVELESPDALLEERKIIVQNNARLEVFSSLQNCVSRFLSEDAVKYEEKAELRKLVVVLQSNIQKRIELYESQNSLLRIKISEKNREKVENYLQQLIGRILQNEILPNLLEKMGYEKNTTTFNLPDRVLEVDGRYEEKLFRGARSERLVGKNVIVIECKTTIELKDIRDYESDVQVIREKYEREKETWNYDRLNFEAWIVACYGWDETLIKEAQIRNLKPITPDKLENELKKRGIFDSRIPICPTSE